MSRCNPEPDQVQEQKRFHAPGPWIEDGHTRSVLNTKSPRGAVYQFAANLTTMKQEEYLAMHKDNSIMADLAEKFCTQEGI